MTTDIRAKLTDREAALAGDMASILDWLSKAIEALGAGDVGSAEEKVWHLIDAVEGLHRQLDRAVQKQEQEPAVRPELLTAAVAQFAGHCVAGRALYPTAAVNEDGAR